MNPCFLCAVLKKIKSRLYWLSVYQSSAQDAEIIYGLLKALMVASTYNQKGVSCWRHPRKAIGTNCARKPAFRPGHAGCACEEEMTEWLQDHSHLCCTAHLLVPALLAESCLPQVVMRRSAFWDPTSGFRVST